MATAGGQYMSTSADNTNSERLREYMAARQRIFNEKPERPARSAATSQPSSSRRRAAAKPSSKPGSNAQSNSTPASTAAQWQRAVPSPAAIAEAQRAAEAEKRAEKDRAAEALAAREKALVKAAIQAAAARERERAAEEAQSAVVSITEVSFDRRNYDAPGAGPPPARSLFEVGPPKPPPRGLFDVNSGNKDGNKGSGRSPRKEARGGAREPKAGKGANKAPPAPLAPRALLTRPAAPAGAGGSTTGSSGQNGLKATAAPFVFKASAPSFVPGGASVGAAGGATCSPGNAAGQGQNLTTNSNKDAPHQDANADLRAAIGAKEFVPSFASFGGGGGGGRSNVGQQAIATLSSAARPPQPLGHEQPSGGLPAPLPASTQALQQQTVTTEVAPAPQAALQPPPAEEQGDEAAAKSDASAPNLEQDLEGFDDYDLSNGGDDDDVDDEEEIVLSGNVP